MILKNCSFVELFNKVPDKSIYCYGIGDFFDRTIKNFEWLDWESKLGGVIDGNPCKIGKSKAIKGFSRKIIAIEDFLSTVKKTDIILITTKSYKEILEKLDSIKKLSQNQCYIYFFMCNKSIGKVDIKTDGDFLIPPVIHYCWFGGKEMPDLYKKCIDSWRRFCPQYEIKEWNETNCDLNENLYARQAYEEKKYGFVPDYFRLKIIYDNGGIYLDTDVEILKNLDNLRHESFFCGLQYPDQVALGLGFGACAKNKSVKKLLDKYESLRFVNEDGSLNQKASPVYQTEDFKSWGFIPGNRKQYVEDICIYPTEVLSPINIYVNSIDVTEYTYAIHHFSGSWVDEGARNKKNAEISYAELLLRRMEREKYTIE